MTDPIQDIIESTNEWGGWGHQNSQLELASLALEARRAGLSYDRLKPTWEKQRDATRNGRGIFLRSPKGSYSSEIANSHDNLIGIAVLSYLLDNGETIKEVIDEGLFFGLWITGKNEKGWWLDSEWFTYIRPDYRAFVKLAAGRKITWFEEAAMRLNIMLATSWNMKRVRLLFLDAIGYDKEFLIAETNKLGDKFKGRYIAHGPNPLYENLWALQGNK
jgi:hypothetical protein